MHRKGHSAGGTEAELNDYCSSVPPSANDTTRPLPPLLYEDERLLVFDKPSGLLSVPGIGPEKADCLAARAARAFPGARIVHRLDRDTSGVIVMARDAEAHRALSGQFERRVVRKRYVAVVGGVMPEPCGRIDLPMRKDLDDTPRQIIDHEHGRAALTDYVVLERTPDSTRVELRPLTGRSHQLRLHLKVIGYPILGDDLYAPPALRAAAPRLMLHATWLEIVHPETAAPVRFEAAVPF